ncbi:BON domain-containing protein [Shewanella gaetbuli]
MMNKTILSLTIGTLLTSATMTANAAQDWKDDAKDAWIDGKAETTLLLNTNLNSFDINTDVKQGKVMLTGSVESSVDKALAEELVASLDGVVEVDNNLTIMEVAEKQDSEITEMLVDSKVATVVKTRLLFSDDVSGSDINVDVESGVVTLEGEVASDAERDLAILLAEKTEDADKVIDKLHIAE